MIKKIAGFFLFILAVGCAPSFAQSSSDYPLLSQGSLEPPPPPPGYAVSLPTMQPFTNVPTPPEPPAKNLNDNSIVPNSARFKQMLLPPVTGNVPQRQIISDDLANEIMRFILSVKTFRTVIESPESDEQLKRIINTGRICSDMLGLQRFPAPSRFVSSSRDRVLRDRSYGSVEYRHFGDFDHRLNGWIKPIETAVFLDLIFDGRSRRRTHVRAQITRNGPITGYFYAYSWDAYGNSWKLQGSLDNVFVRDNGLPSGGEIKIYGADPAGRVMTLALSFPIEVQGEEKPEKKDTRHRQGQRVSIGNN